MHEFKRIDGQEQNISLFSLQGLEKLNDMTTMQFHRATNKNKFQKLKTSLQNFEPDVTELRVNIEICGDIFDTSNSNESKMANNSNLDRNGKAYLVQLINLRNRNDEGLNEHADGYDDDE